MAVDANASLTEPGERASTPPWSVPQQGGECWAIVLEPRKLYSECLTREICRAINGQARSYSDINDWLTAGAGVTASAHRVSIIVACLSGMKPAEESQYMARLSPSVQSSAPVVIIGDCKEPQHIVDILSHGARGYIPTSISLDLMTKALQLVMAGGLYIPAVCLQAPQDTPRPESADQLLFTGRQIAVIEALRQGKPNKTIAFELKMRESTVKVHVRNIMKKLNAKNRTEVSFLVSQMQNYKTQS